MPTPLSSLSTTSTFRQWYEGHNAIVTLLNNNALVDNTAAYGVFVIAPAANTSLSVSNTFLVNTSLILARANTTLAANVAVTANANVFTIAAGTLIIQPVNGTTVNSALTVNAVTDFRANVAANASLTVANTLVVTGNTTVNTDAQFNAGAINARQMLYVQTGSMAANTLADPSYNDFAPTGLANCQILNLTPNIDATLTGLSAPSIAAGARVLYVQNLSSTYKITLKSANTSSAANNRFKTPNDADFDIQPGAAATLIWTFTNKEWRILSGSMGGGATTLGNTTINGTLTVSGNSTFNANATFSSNVAVSRLTASVQLTTANLTVSHTATIANAVVSGNSSFSANVSMTQVMRMSGASARFILPVGTNMYATS